VPTDSDTIEKELPSIPASEPASPHAAHVQDLATDMGMRSMSLGRRVLWPQDGDDKLRPILPLSPRLVDDSAPFTADAAGAEAMDRRSWPACRRLIDGRP